MPSRNPLNAAWAAVLAWTNAPARSKIISGSVTAAASASPDRCFSPSLPAADEDVIALKYDESLASNPFYKGALAHSPGLLEDLASKEQILCVPCTPAAVAAHLQQPSHDQLQTHILTRSGAENEYVTANKKMLRIEGSFIKPLAGFKSKRLVRVLFEETTYTASAKQVTVLCIENALEVRL